MKKKHPTVGKLPRVIYGVEFRHKSNWQKDDCINNPYFGGTCRRASTMEAVKGNTLIRCCSSTACKRFAAKLAKMQTALSPKKANKQKAFLVGIHPWTFRVGKPAEIISIKFITPKDQTSRPCYQIRFSDGKKDSVVLSDVHKAHHYVIISELDVQLGQIPKAEG